MTQIEDRVRSALVAEAEARARTMRSEPSIERRPRVTWSGARLAVTVAAVVMALFGGVSLVTGGDGGDDVANEQLPPSEAPPAPDPSVPAANSDGWLEATPFSGPSWQFTVTEQANPSDATYEVCFAVHPVKGSSDAPAVGPPWCDSWPKSDPRIGRYLLGVHHGMVSPTSYVMVVELNDQPVDRVAVSGIDVHEVVTPFALPGSGKQFAVVEVPQSNGTVSVSALDQTGAELDRYEELLGRIEPLVVDGTPIDDTTVSDVASMMGGQPLSDRELEAIHGSVDLAHSGYLIASKATDDGVYELGLIVYQEKSTSPFGLPVICFSEYAMTQGVNVGGGSVCAQTQERAEDLAKFHLGAGGSCGAHPKEESVVEGNWLTLAMWGIPATAGTVTVRQGDGDVVDIDVANGVALHIWEGKVDIASIAFEGMTREQADFISDSMPIEGIGDDCNQSNGNG